MSANKKPRISIINGPNINMLGKRESIYGSFTLEELTQELIDRYATIFELSFFQSNHEGELIEHIQQSEGNVKGLVINPAALTHSSIGIRDALACLTIPKVEVHISNIYQREDYRKISYTASECNGVITGLGKQGYLLAVQYLESELLA